MRRLGFSAVLLASLLAAAPAGADAPLDTVHLKNGGFVRGVVIESVPARPVRVQFPDGTAQFFAPEEVLRIDLGGAAAGAPPPPPPGAEVQFEAAGDEPFILRRLDEPVEARRPVLCGTPCTVRLPPGTYPLRATATGMQSVEGTIVVRDQTMRVRVESQSEAREIAGILLTFGGAGTFLFGLLAVAGAESDGFEDPETGRRIDVDFVRTVGLVMMGVGAAAGVGGAILWFGETPRLRTYAREP